MSKQYLSTFSAKKVHSSDIFAIATTSTSILSASGGEDLQIHSTVGPALTPDTDSGSDVPYQLLQTIKAVHRLGCHHLVTSKDGRRAASVGFEGDLLVWAANDSSQELARSSSALWVKQRNVEDKVRTGDIWAIALSADAQYLASTSIDGHVHVWDLGTVPDRNVPNQEKDITTHKNEEQHPQETGKGTGTKIREYTTRIGFGMCIDLSSDGELTAVGSSVGHVMILSNSTGRPMHHTTSGATTLGSCAIRSVKFSPHNSLLAAAGDARVIALYSIANNNSGEEVGLLKGHTAWIFTVDWNIDGTLLVSGDWAGQARVWDIDSKQCLWTGSANADGVIWSIKWLPYSSKSPMIRHKSQSFVVGGRGGNLTFFREGGAS